MVKNLQKYMRIGYFVAVISLFLYILYTENVKVIMFFSDIKKIENYIMAWGRLSPLIFIMIQFSQVIFFFIPGEFVQISGGFLFGTLFGSILSLIGITLGTIFSFQVSRVFGSKFLDKAIKKNEYQAIKKILLRTENKQIVFILYLLPGFPKDILGYILGITKINIKTFMGISILGRLPGIVVTSLIGQNIHAENYAVVIYLALISIILVLVGYKKRSFILKYMNDKTK